jgi:hypothetical protein
MKKIIGFLAVCTTSYVFAQAGVGPSNQAPTVDAVEIVSIDQMPLPLPPGEAEKMRNSSRAVATDGFSLMEKSPETVKGFFAHMNAAKTYIARQGTANGQQNKEETGVPEIHKDLSKLKIRFKPKALSRGTLIAAAPSGTKIDDTWTGVDRFFHIEGVGSLRLSEVDLAATGGKFYMMKEAVNARVHGKPAISRVFTDDDGLTIEEVVWVEGGKFYMLTFGPNVTPGSRVKAAPHINAHSLAQELS